jgi:hypothetical protein
MQLRRQLEQQQMDSIRKWIDPAYQGILAIDHLTNKSSPAASAINSLPVPTPQAPITAANAEVLQAQDAFAKASLLKKSVKDTIWAGDTGGFKPGEAGYPGGPTPGPLTYRK